MIFDKIFVNEKNTFEEPKNTLYFRIKDKYDPYYYRLYEVFFSWLNFDFRFDANDE